MSDEFDPGLGRTRSADELPCPGDCQFRGSAHGHGSRPGAPAAPNAYESSHGNYLVTFADGLSTLVVDRAAADQIVAYWPQLKPTIRDLDQEARDREEMIGLLASTVAGPGLWKLDGSTAKQRDALLKRLGRLP